MNWTRFNWDDPTTHAETDKEVLCCYRRRPDGPRNIEVGQVVRYGPIMSIETENLYMSTNVNATIELYWCEIVNPFEVPIELDLV